MKIIGNKLKRMPSSPPFDHPVSGCKFGGVIITWPVIITWDTWPRVRGEVRRSILMVARRHGDNWLEFRGEVFFWLGVFFFARKYPSVATWSGSNRCGCRRWPVVINYNSESANDWRSTIGGLNWEWPLRAIHDRLNGWDFFLRICGSYE